MRISKYIKLLEKHDACIEAITWSKQFKTPQEAWEACERPDWMAWLIAEFNPSEPYSDERKPLVSLCIKFVRTVWEQLPGESKDAIKVFERWVNGEDISREDLSTASRAAANAATCAAATAAAAAYASYAATCAAATADAAACAAACAAYAARATKGSARITKIIRKDYPNIYEIIGK